MDFPRGASQFEVEDADPELKTPEISVNVIAQDWDVVESVATRISKWTKIVRVFVWVHRFLDGCRKCRRTGPISVDEMERARLRIIRTVQQKMLKENPVHVETPKSQKTQKHDKLNIWKLDPFLDEHGVLRAGGRLRNALGIESRPVILHRKGMVAVRIAEFCHQRVETGYGDAGRADDRPVGQNIEHPNADRALSCSSTF